MSAKEFAALSPPAWSFILLTLCCGLTLGPVWLDDCATSRQCQCRCGQVVQILFPLVVYELRPQMNGHLGNTLREDGNIVQTREWRKDGIWPPFTPMKTGAKEQYRRAFRKRPP